MGGIKNREAKRKANNVFVSGGGGGSKGPAVVDKRNQELKCPHCDRVFKQNDRLKQHIDNQHSEPVNLSDTLPALASNVSSASGSGPKAALDIRESANSKSSSCGSTSQQPMSDSAASTTGVARSMDINSKAGYYTEKTPKLLLHELCMREKRPRARFKVIPVDDSPGLFRCKVVLPDEKKSEKDIVVWLDGKYGAADAAEAEQRGAVAALHRLEGNRNLSYILPARYRELWSSLVKKAQEDRERSVIRQQALAKKKEREQGRAAAHARRAPVDVIMTDEQRAMVEEVVKQLARSEIRGDTGPTGIGCQDRSSGEALQEVRSRLQSYGFAAQDISAMQQEVDCSGNVEDCMKVALNWLCIHTPEERLPQRFGPGISRAVGIIRTSSQYPASSAATRKQEPENHTDDALHLDPVACQLIDWGYPEQHVTAVLQQCAGHLLSSFYVLYTMLFTGRKVDAGTVTSAHHEPEVWG